MVTQSTSHVALAYGADGVRRPAGVVLAVAEIDEQLILDVVGTTVGITQIANPSRGFVVSPTPVSKEILLPRYSVPFADDQRFAGGKGKQREPADRHNSIRPYHRHFSCRWPFGYKQRVQQRSGRSRG